MNWREPFEQSRRIPASIGRFQNVTPFSGSQDYYLATHPFPAEPTIHTVLLRVVAIGHQEDQVRLQRMARLLSGLDSPYVPTCIDLGMEEGWEYLALRVDPPIRLLSSVYVDRLTTARQIAEGLSYLHDRKLAHRGLTPETIAVNEFGTPLLYDLWWMRPFKSDRMVPSILAWKGRTRYDPPEACESQYDGVKGDIYSLGVIADELGLPSRYTPVVERMKAALPKERPSSMRDVIEEIG